MALHERLLALDLRGVSGVRVGIHAAELVTAPDGPDGDPGLPDQAVEIAVTVKDLARRGQILLTRSPFDAARQEVISAPDGSPLEWLAHGSYLVGSVDEPVEVFEVGVRGDCVTDRPPDSRKARRDVSIAEESVLGWRPAAGLRIPGRNQWLLERKLGEGGSDEVWVAREETSKETRAFKFCFRAERLRALKREMTLFGLITESLGERRDIARLHGVRLDEAPYYLELEYTEGGNLAAWAERHGGIGKVPLAERL